jgi:hypothetical protein
LFSDEQENSMATPRNAGILKCIDLIMKMYNRNTNPSYNFFKKNTLQVAEGYLAGCTFFRFEDMPFCQKPMLL